MTSLSRKMSSRQPGQYGSNGLRTDGTSFNVGNKLGDRPSIRLFSKYNTGAAMSAILSQTAGSDSELEDEAPNETGARSPRRAEPVLVPHQSRAKTQLDFEWGQRRLLDAVRGNRAREVRAAVEDGADVTKADERGWTPLHVAAHVGKPRMCELLVELGAVRASLRCAEKRIFRVSMLPLMLTQRIRASPASSLSS
jgi:ankyrin repeat protein